MDTCFGSGGREIGTRAQTRANCLIPLGGLSCCMHHGKDLVRRQIQIYGAIREGKGYHSPVVEPDEGPAFAGPYYEASDGTGLR